MHPDIATSLNIASLKHDICIQSLYSFLSSCLSFLSSISHISLNMDISVFKIFTWFVLKYDTELCTDWLQSLSALETTYMAPKHHPTKCCSVGQSNLTSSTYTSSIS